MHGYFVSSVGILSFLLHIKWYSPTINMELFALLYTFVCALSGLCTMQYSVYLVSMEMFLLNKIFKYLKKMSGPNQLIMLSVEFFTLYVTVNASCV